MYNFVSIHINFTVCMEHVDCQAPTPAPAEAKPAVPWGGLRVAWQVTGIATPR
jgi:hypothetical protein